MRREHHAHAFGAQAVDQFPHRHAGLRIETGRGFVQEHDARVVDDGTRDHQASFEAA
jgi:hypothetical protein